jgi:hypothetical protein
MEISDFDKAVRDYKKAFKADRSRLLEDAKLLLKNQNAKIIIRFSVLTRMHQQIKSRKHEK